MNYRNRRLVKYEDLNPSNTLFGGTLLSWLDEEGAIYASCQLENQNVVTKFISEINFLSPSKVGDIIEIGCETLSFGRTSITISCTIRNKITKQDILKVEKMVFVCVDSEGKPKPHNIT